MASPRHPRVPLPLAGLIFALSCWSLWQAAQPTASSAAPAPAARRLSPGDHSLELRHGGRARTYLVHVPPAARRGRPLPLVLSFHGGGGNGAHQQQYNGMDALADRAGFVVVYPDGTGRLRRMLTWNAGSCCGASAETKVNDVGFSLAVVDDLARRLAIDARRVYATGMSNGGMMAHRLAAEAPARIAAIAPVAGGLVYEPLAPARPVPVLHIHSVDDPRALYYGGLAPPFPGTNLRVVHPNIDQVMADWAKANGCTGGPVEQAERANAAGHTASLLVWQRCPADGEVRLWRLTGAGHVWPGRPNAVPRPGNVETDVLDANAEMWAFFSRFRR